MNAGSGEMHRLSGCNGSTVSVTGRDGGPTRIRLKQCGLEYSGACGVDIQKNPYESICCYNDPGF